MTLTFKVNEYSISSYILLLYVYISIFITLDFESVNENPLITSHDFNYFTIIELYVYVYTYSSIRVVIVFVF